MKATLEFSLPDDSNDHKLALHGIDFYCAIADIKEHIRQKLKYGNLSESQAAAYIDLQGAISNILFEQGIDMDSFE